MLEQEEVNRMRWASRRGMLELDLVLEPFVRERYAGLNARDRARYQSLVRCEDQDLFTWFMRREVPEDAEHAAIVSIILAHTLGAADS